MMYKVCKVCKVYKVYKYKVYKVYKVYEVLAPPPQTSYPILVGLIGIILGQ